MKRSLRLLAGLPLILSAACASLPGMASVPPPDQAAPPPALPIPLPCQLAPEEPERIQVPSLPAEVAPPTGARETLEWWRGLALHFQSRALRAETVQATAANVAEEERRTRLQNANNQTDCTAQLRNRAAE